MNQFNKSLVFLIASMSASLACSSAAFESAGDGWKPTVGMYMLTQSIEAESTVQGIPIAVPVSLDFKDVLDNLDNLFVAFFRYGNGIWGVELDYANIGLDTGTIAFDVEEIELYGTYRLQNIDITFDILAGVRYIEHELNIVAPVPEPFNFGDDWIDPFVGMRVMDNFEGSDWFYISRVDVGGFGVGSDFTWRFDLGVGYLWDNGWQFAAHYKRLDIDYDNESSTDLYKFDGYEEGIFIGAAYTFK